MKIKPFTVAQQLQRMSDWHQVIVSRPPSSSTAREFLVDCWEDLETASPNIQANKTYLLRDGTHDGIPPLAQLFDYLESGLYPPPELLLTLLDAWRTYAESGGDVPLENALLGKPVQKAGNYAKRSMKKRKDMGSAFGLGELIDQGKKKAEAVEILVSQYRVREESVKKIKPIPPFVAEESEK